MNTPPDHRVTLNTNTGLSIGIVITLFGGFAWVIKAQNETKNDLSMQAIQSNNLLTNKIDKLESRMTTLESTRNSWTSTDMFRWAVHLQQANPQIKVPEPETETKK